jgi:perosamine synthetase
VHEELGWNFRMTNMQAALGLAQLERLDDFVKRKRAMGLKYRKAFEEISCIEMPPEKMATSENIYWVFGIVLKENVSSDAEAVMKKLGDLGVGTRPFFWPMHEQPVFLKRGWYNVESYPHAERIARRGFYIPSGLALTDEQMNHVIESVKTVLRPYEHL